LPYLFSAAFYFRWWRVGRVGGKFVLVHGVALPIDSGFLIV
jgi:hypothetical protein